jgi:perosamine synthetase
MTNLQGALGVAQLERIDDHLAIKKNVGKLYREGLKDLQGFSSQQHDAGYAENIYWVFGLVAHNEAMATAMVKNLNDAGIGSRPFFWCMHEQPVFLKMGLFANESYPVAERLARNGFYIPSGLGLTEAEQQHVIKCVRTYAG